MFKIMNIKERIKRLGTYFNSMNIAAENNIIYVLVNFPQGWGCSEVTEHNFNVKTVRDENPGYFYFFADMEIGFDKVFDAIEYNIKFNEDAQAKVTLLRKKIEELKDIFEQEDIQTLQTIEFKFKKKATKSAKSKKAEEPTIIQELEMKEDSEINNSDGLSLEDKIINNHE